MKSSILVIVCFALSAVTWASETAAVMTLKNNGGLSDGEVNIMTERVDYSVAQSTKFTLISRTDIDEILKEQGFQQSGACANKSCLVEVGQLLAVKNIISGSIGKMGSIYSISLKMYDVQTGEIKAQIVEDFKGSKEELLSHSIPYATKKLIKVYSGEKISENNQNKTKSTFVKKPAFWVPVSVAVVGGILGGVLFGSSQSEGGAADEGGSAYSEISLPPPGRN